MTLQQSALTAGASNVDTDRQNTLGQTLNKLSGAALLTYGGQGQAHVTPESLQLSAGQDVITTAGRHASMNVMKKFSLAVGETLSLFARKLGIQMVAGAGDITTQAQRGAIHMLSAGFYANQYGRETAWQRQTGHTTGVRRRRDPYQP